MVAIDTFDRLYIYRAGINEHCDLSSVIPDTDTNWRETTFTGDRNFPIETARQNTPDAYFYTTQTGWQGWDSPDRDISTATPIGAEGAVITSTKWRPRNISIPVQVIGAATANTQQALEARLDSFLYGTDQPVTIASTSANRFDARFLVGSYFNGNAFNIGNRMPEVRKHNLSFVSPFPFFIGIPKYRTIATGRHTEAIRHTLHLSGANSPLYTNTPIVYGFEITGTIPQVINISITLRTGTVFTPTVAAFSLEPRSVATFANRLRVILSTPFRQSWIEGASTERSSIFGSFFGSANNYLAGGESYDITATYGIPGEADTNTSAPGTRLSVFYFDSYPRG